VKIAFAVLIFVVHAFAADTPSLDYDKNAPLRIDEQEVAVRDGVRVSRFSYASPKGGRSDGMLVRPVKVNGKTGGIIWTRTPRVMPKYKPSSTSDVAWMFWQRGLTSTRTASLSSDIVTAP
jgi:hypothetical protein